MININLLLMKLQSSEIFVAFIYKVDLKLQSSETSKKKENTLFMRLSLQLHLVKN